MCGYCGRRLEVAAVPPLPGRTCYECPACAPQLRKISSVEEWRRFCRRHPPIPSNPPAPEPRQATLW